MEENDKVFLGVLGKPRGLKGHIRFHLYNADTTLVQKKLQFYIEGEEEPFEVASFAPYQKSHILVIKNCADINLVEKYKGKKIFVLRKQLAPLVGEEYYHVDLVGCAVVDEGGVLIGKVGEVLPTGANDILSVVSCQGDEVLIPFIKQYVLAVDMDAKRIIAVVPEVLA